MTIKVISSKKRYLPSPEERRRLKAIQLVKKGYVVILDQTGTEFKVWSETEEAVNGRHPAYSIILSRHGNACTCPDYKYSLIECKHIKACKIARHELGYPIKDVMSY